MTSPGPRPRPASAAGRRAAGRRAAGRLAAAALLAALLAPAGCASTDPADAPGAPSGTDAAADGGTTSEVRATARVPDDAEVGRALIEVDRRVDEHVYLGTQTGEDVRERRRLVESALEATVAQYLPSLLAAADDAADPARRRIAAKALAFTRDPRAVPVLARCLGARGDARLLTGATFALARIASPETPLPPLLEAARDPDADVRSNALLALWHVLDAKREAAKPPLDGAASAAALAAIEPALFDLGDAIVRGNAASALGALGDPRGVDSLTNLLRDQHPYVRTHTAIALAKLGDRRAILPLVDVIDETAGAAPRSAVLHAVEALMERHGHALPPNLGQEERAWRAWVERSFESGSRR